MTRPPAPPHPFATLVDVDGAGAHPAAWRATADPAALLAPARLREIARLVDHGFTAAVFDGSPLAPDAPHGVRGRFDPVQAAAFLAPLTRRAVLVPVVDAALTEPFHIATQLASLDHASRGRAGVIVSARGSARAAATVGRDAVDDPAGELADAIEVYRRLWDSWEDDAVIRDVASGRYLDAERLHYVDFISERYTVRGPAITPRPPQGNVPVLVAADAVGAEASGADVAILAGGDLDALTAAVTARRAGGAERVVVEAEIVLDHDGVPARDRLARLDDAAPWHPSGRLRLVGSPALVTARLAELATHADGVRLLPAVLDIDGPGLAADVLPSLPRQVAASSTFRAALGLPTAQNRYATR